MIGSLASGELVGRFGAIRISQACVILCAVGMLTMAALPASFAVLFALTAVLMGMGYGPITVASSEVLARTTRPERMALTFSIKQTGVPAGAAISLNGAEIGVMDDSGELSVMAEVAGTHRFVFSLAGHMDQEIVVEVDRAA